MKKTAASSRSDRQSPVLRGVLPALCVVLAAFAFVSQPPRELLHGFWQILISDAGLITDPAVTGGAGARASQCRAGAGVKYGTGLCDAPSRDGSDICVPVYDGRLQPAGQKPAEHSSRAARRLALRKISGRAVLKIYLPDAVFYVSFPAGELLAGTSARLVVHSGNALFRRCHRLFRAAHRGLYGQAPSGLRSL